jgi:Fe-S-cluster containining protein
MSKKLDCRKCGACCISNWGEDTYAYVSEKDIRRLRKEFTERTVKRLINRIDEPLERGLRVKENKQGLTVCISHRGSIGRQCSCSIYKARPTVCREFKPGNYSCQLAREEAGLDD